MSTAQPEVKAGPPQASLSPNEKAVDPSVRRRRTGNSVLAHAEPMMWLAGGGLVTCVLMIIGLLIIVIYQGIITFWPVQLVQIKTSDERVLLGEVTRESVVSLDYSLLATTSGTPRTAASQLLNPLLASRARESADDPRRLAEFRDAGLRNLIRELEDSTLLRQASGEARQTFLKQVSAQWQTWTPAFGERFRKDLNDRASADPSGQGLYDWWQEAQIAYDGWLAAADLDQLAQPWKTTDETSYSIWVHATMRLLTADLAVAVPRRLLRTGNYELTNEHFAWVSDFEIAPHGESLPEWALVVERLSWGRFYGEPRAFLIDGQPVANEPDRVWSVLQEHHPAVRERWRERRALERDEIGAINARLENERLALRQIAIDEGESSDGYRKAETKVQESTERAEAAFAEIRERIARLDEENGRYQLRMVTSDGQEKDIPLAEVVRAYPANRLSFGAALGVYTSRWHEFLTDEPREANSEGGVLPAIFGTVVMTVLMSVAVVPFGVLASLYLREYARAGLMVSVVRIAVNNLAGVPSIVFGVFGLGFFCYIFGASIDQLFFEAKLPNPTFGTGGLLWASLTLALLTLPVVIVATEEALAAVPNSLREGSYACGASKWQTIRRIVLPHAMPGIMTGTILAMARGAGEVAPLMLVGAVKLAPELPVNGIYPYVHLSRSFMHLGFHIYDLGFQSQNSEAAKPMVFTTTLLLMAIIAFLNVAAISLRSRLRRKLHVGRF